MLKVVLLLLILAPALYCLGTFASAMAMGMGTGMWKGTAGGRKYWSLLPLAAAARETALQYYLWVRIPWDLLRPGWPGCWGQEGPLVVLIPGFTETAAIFKRLESALVGRGCNVFIYRFHTFNGNLPVEAGRLRSTIEELAARFPAHEVVLVGHSLGALLGRTLVESGGLGSGTRQVVFCGPHHGTRIARLALGRCGRQMAPDHGFIQQLAPVPTGRMLNIWTVHDNLIVPTTSAQLGGCEELVVGSGWGHNSLLWCSEAVEAAVAWIVEDHVR